jgi:hypothetical protein
MRNLSDETVKRKIVILGLEYGSALRALQSAYNSKDDARKDKAWSRVGKVSVSMSELFDEVLRKPAGMFEIRADL